MDDLKKERHREICRNWYHRHKQLKGRSYKTVICSICGKEFETNTNKRYCSEECKKQARKNTIKKYDDSHKEEKRNYQKKYMEKYGDLVRARHRNNYKENGGKERAEKYRKEHKEEIKIRTDKWVQNNKDKVKIIKDRYKEKNQEKINENAKILQRKYRENTLYRLKCNISRAFSRYFNKEKPTLKYLKYFDYNLKDLYNHLEKQFKNGMTWGNYGTIWHIDHIIPQSWFDFSNIEEIKKCWSLDNLQPLLISENCRKGNRYAG